MTPVRRIQERRLPVAAEIGQQAPAFDLPSQTGDRVSLADFKGKKHVVLSFHIFDFTST